MIPYDHGLPRFGRGASWCPRDLRNRPPGGKNLNDGKGVRWAYSIVHRTPFHRCGHTGGSQGHRLPGGRKYTAPDKGSQQRLGT